MKQISKLSFALAAMVAASALRAVEVTSEEAQTAASNWISQNPGGMDSKFQSGDAESTKTGRTKTGRAVYHAVNLKGGGFVVTSGDTRLPAIIAFSDMGRFDGAEGSPFRALLTKSLAGAVSALERSDRKAAAYKGAGGGDSPYAAAMAEWAALLPSSAVAASSFSKSASRKSSVSDVRVGALCKTTWHQWSNVYSYYMPGYAAGCVAVAGAQVMKRWGRPTASVAQFSNKCRVDGKEKTLKSVAGAFDWDNMALSYSADSPEKQRKAVGMLMYNIGVAVGMEYTPGASSADPVNLINAFKTRFGYKSGEWIYYPIDALSMSTPPEEMKADFDNALYASLDAKMPVVLSINGEDSDGYSLGHAIVADGYGYVSGKRYTHLNFGYAGEGDAWYYIINEPCAVDWGDGYVENYFTFNSLSFNIHPTQAGDVVSGRVLDASGAPVPSATVRLYDAADNLKMTVTADSKGIYSFRVAAAGDYNVEASHDAADETPSTSVSLESLTHTGDWYAHPGGRCGNKWGVDVQFSEWSLPTERKLTLKSSSTSRGTVSGGGTYMAGTAVTLKAKAKSGSAFAGWFTDKSCKNELNPKGYDNRNPTVKVAMPSANTTIYAKFISKAADKKALRFSSSTEKLAKKAKKGNVGESFTLKLGISSASLPSVSAEGLPSGLKIDTSTGKITGTPKNAGSFTATVTVKSAAGNKITQKVKITVYAPEWMRGTYEGVAMPGATAGEPPAHLMMTVGSTGKVTGKVIYKGKAYSFTAKSSSCSVGKLKFSPSVKIGTTTFKPGAVTVLNDVMDGRERPRASSSNGRFLAYRSFGLVTEGGIAEAYIGESVKVTQMHDVSGLQPGTVNLKVVFGSSDHVSISGKINGKKFSSSVQMILKSYDVDNYTFDTMYGMVAPVIFPGGKYYRTLRLKFLLTEGGEVTLLEPELDGFEAMRE